MNSFLSDPFAEIPVELQESAEHIATYLVNVRGGALFLSGADLRLLVEWLQGDVPVPAILCAIDKVSEKRRLNRTRTRLSLNQCKAALKKILYRSTEERSFGKDAPSSYREALQRWALDLRNSWTEEALLEGRQKQFANRLEQLGRQLTLNTSRDEIASSVIPWINEFQNEAWAEYGSMRVDWFEEAELELQSLRTLFTGQQWVEAVEEVVRTRTRRLFPLIQAQVLWDCLNEVQV